MVITTGKGRNKPHTSPQEAQAHSMGMMLSFQPAGEVMVGIEVQH